MNFYGHLAVGYGHQRDLEFLLGTMLPDFASMAGLRAIEAPGAPAVQAGIEFHHRTDAVFHRAPVFTGLVAEGIDSLIAQSLPRGAARAVAHVGVELILDGLILDNHGQPRRDAYTQALETGLTEATAGQVTTRALVRAGASKGQPARPAATLPDLLRRLMGAPIPEGYRDPRFVGERLQRILSPRPRLALPEGSLAAVVAWLATTQQVLTGRYEELMAQVATGLEP